MQSSFCSNKSYKYHPKWPEFFILLLGNWSLGLKKKTVLLNEISFGWSFRRQIIVMVIESSLFYVETN